jgi:F-type H+-transporting ATPase subunit b
MNINVTLFGQMITFAIFIWFTLKFVWPPITAALEEREQNIAKGIQDAKKAEEALNDAENEAEKIKADAIGEAKSIVTEARKKANDIVADARENAIKQYDYLVSLSNKEIESQAEKARLKLLQEVSEFAILGSEKILQKEVDKKESARIIEEIITEGGC